MNNNYEDIINLPHHTSKKHIRMSIEARSAQFAPFQALTGYNDSIKETERITDKQIELTEEEKQLINDKIKIIEENLQEEIKITYFERNDKKTGGRYITIKTRIKKINLIEKYILLEDKTKIEINNIIDIKSDLFKNIE